MARQATLIGTATDFWGDGWDVRESRETAHGFELLFGWPDGCRGKGFGGPRLIATKELNGYFIEHALDRDGSIYDLPAGRTAIKRIRQLLGHNLYTQSAAWWEDRIDDLSDLSGGEFARKHSVDESTVSEWRKALLGVKRLREPMWWKHEGAASILGSDLPRSFVAQVLDISVGSVGRLRWRIRSVHPDICSRCRKPGVQYLCGDCKSRLTGIARRKAERVDPARLDRRRSANAEYMRGIRGNSPRNP
jgi:hypothetical protein